jgi:hypothetical protein
MQVRRLKEFGVTKGELNRYMDALLKDSEHLAAMIDNVSSVDNLEFITESDALGHTVMDQRQGHESLFAVAGTVTPEEVNSIMPCQRLLRNGYHQHVARPSQICNKYNCMPRSLFMVL